MHPRPPSIRRGALAAAALLLLAVAPPAPATTVIALTPSEVDALAHRIVEARVVGAADVRVAGGIVAIEYELAVERVIKDDGSVAPQMAQNAGRMTLRQVGSLDRTRPVAVIGMPRYVVGERYRLALNGDSVLGLSSPVGLGQGVTRLGEAEPPSAAAPAP